MLDELLKLLSVDPVPPEWMTNVEPSYSKLIFEPAFINCSLDKSVIKFCFELDKSTIVWFIIFMELSTIWNVSYNTLFSIGLIESLFKDVSIVVVDVIVTNLLFVSNKILLPACINPSLIKSWIISCFEFKLWDKFDISFKSLIIPDKSSIFCKELQISDTLINVSITILLLLIVKYIFGPASKNPSLDKSLNIVCFLLISFKITLFWTAFVE